MDLKSLPIELQYKILSFLPYGVLSALKLSNKEYWEIFRSKTIAVCDWNDNLNWCSKFSDTHILRLIDGVHILTISDLNYFQKNLNHFNNSTKIKCINLAFQLKAYLSGYLWKDCARKSEPTLNDIAQILNIRDGTGLLGTYHEGEIVRNNTKLSEKMYCFYDKYRKSIENKIVCDEYDFGQIVKSDAVEQSDEDDDDDKNDCKCENCYIFDDDLDHSDGSVDVPRPLCKYIQELHNLPILFYLTVIPGLNKVNGDINVCKVFTHDEENNCKISEIGRVVISKELLLMMGDQAGVAVLKKDTAIAGFGNFLLSQCDRAEYDSNNVSFYPRCFAVLKSIFP